MKMAVAVAIPNADGLIAAIAVRTTEPDETALETGEMNAVDVRSDVADEVPGAVGDIKVDAIRFVIAAIFAAPVTTSG